MAIKFTHFKPLQEEVVKLKKKKDELIAALGNAIKFIKCCPELANEDRRPRGLEKWEQLLDKVK